MSDTWETYWSEVGNETWLVARDLIELSTSVRAHFAGYIEPTERDGLHLDWSKAAAAADEWPASSTERRLLALVLSLVNPDEHQESEVVRDEDEGGYYTVWRTAGTRKIDVRDLAHMGSWQEDVTRILSRWMNYR